MFVDNPAAVPAGRVPETRIRSRSGGRGDSEPLLAVPTRLPSREAGNSAPPHRLRSTPLPEEFQCLLAIDPGNVPQSFGNRFRGSGLR